MIEPNFGEPQLQQTINSAIVFKALEEHGVHVDTIVPTLVAESGLGWDSAFHLPWIGLDPLINNDGCNFFIQYKLSTLIEGRRGGQWSDWHCPYFRFKIPHTKKVGVEYIPDFHQYDALKSLSALPCQVYYATNHVTTRAELFNEAASRTLYDRVPLLSVRDMNQHHHFATFTESSGHFYLHSEPLKHARLSGSKALRQIAETEMSSLEAGNEILLSGLKMLAERNRELSRYIKLYSEIDLKERQMPRGFLSIFQFRFLQSTFRESIGVSLYRWSEYGANKALQPTPSRFALGVARTHNFQKITRQIRSPVQGG